jgi:hypothetical protein
MARAFAVWRSRMIRYARQRGIRNTVATPPDLEGQLPAITGRSRNRHDRFYKRLIRIKPFRNRLVLRFCR